MRKSLKIFITLLLLLAIFSSLMVTVFAGEPNEEDRMFVWDPQRGQWVLSPSDPDITDDPNQGTDPEPSDNPGVGDDPKPTESPEPTQSPGITEPPNPTDNPGPTENPGNDPSHTEEPDPQPIVPIMGDRFIRVGMKYGSSAMDGANLQNKVGSGFWVGYYDSDNHFIPLGRTAQTNISVIKTENVYYGTYNGYTSYHDNLTDAAVGVGCYHLQIPGNYDSFNTAFAAAEQYDGGFVAYVGGTYYVRIGNYLVRDDAVAAQERWASAGVFTELKGTSSFGISVVLRGTNQILFQYDDNGSGTGLGIMPIPITEGEKCVTHFMGYTYYGGFRYERIKGGNLTVVNVVDMEDYVNCVVSREMSDSWPIEALKAQAVAARSYAATLKSHSAHHFDVCPSTHCQAYYGTSKVGENTLRAAMETERVYAWYGDRIAQTFYYSSNGGASESSSVVWGSNQASYPYLIGVIDPYEATVEDMISGYQWTRQYTGDEMAQTMRKAGYTSCSKVVSVTISAYSDTGNPKSVVISDDKGHNFTLSANNMIKIFGMRSYRYDLKNTQESQLFINGTTLENGLNGLYAIDGNGNLIPVDNSSYLITGTGEIVPAETSGTVTGDLFTFIGKGWGHNVGMSQYGAYAMAKLGYTYDEILKFYYTGIMVG